MTPTTWTELKAAVTARAIRDDLDDMAADFISDAEDMFALRLFSPDRETTVTLSVTDGVASVPDDFKGLVSVYVDGSRDRPLVQKTEDELRSLWPTSEAGQTVNFAIVGETIIFGPLPSPGTVIKLSYTAGFAKLGESQASNWLLGQYPSLYIQASLAELYAYTRDEGEARARIKAEALIELVSRELRRRKGNSGPLVAQPRATDALLSYLPR